MAAKKELNPLETLYKRNKQWARFAEEYVVHFNGSKAARDAGYAASGARRMAFKLIHEEPIVKDAIDFLTAELAKTANITADSVRMELEQTRRLAIEDGQLSVAKECSVWKGKSIAMFTDSIETTVRFEDLTDSELDERIREAATQAGIGITAGGKGTPEK